MTNRFFCWCTYENLASMLVKAPGETNEQPHGYGSKLLHSGYWFRVIKRAILRIFLNLETKFHEHWPFAERIYLFTLW